MKKNPKRKASWRVKKFIELLQCGNRVEVDIRTTPDVQDDSATIEIRKTGETILLHDNGEWELV